MGWVSAVRVYWRGYGTCGHVMNFSRVCCYGGLQAQSLCEASIHGSAVQGIQWDLNSKNSFGHVSVYFYTRAYHGSLLRLLIPQFNEFG